jgi:hypothetical protein
LSKQQQTEAGGNIMIILWIRKKNTEQKNGLVKDNKESFQKHDEVMKQFRLAHPDTNVINARDIITSDGNLLAPVDKVKLTEHVQN